MHPPRPAANAPPIRPLDTLWQAGTVIRIVLAGEALAVVLALAPGVGGDRLAYFGMASFAIQWIALMAMGLLFLGRRGLARASPVQVARIALGSLLLSTWLVTGLGWLVLHDIWPAPKGGWLAIALKLTIMALTVGMLALAAFRGHWHVRQMAVRAKQAELEALQARVRPHFLFNTLNTGIALVHSRPQEAERLLLDLSDLFRAALSGRSEVSLGEELSLAQRYLEIEALRFGERLDLRWQISATDAELQAATLPALSVQPLVENAIRHGVESGGSGGRIGINVESTGGFITVTVRNSVPSGGQPSPHGHRIGLAAVRARLEAMTGDGDSLETSSRPDEFVATLRIRKQPA
ncbi:sensor histidine kinase [Luteimonas sp. A534]